MDFLAKCKDRYRSLYAKTKLLSKIPVFLVALISLLSLGDLLYALNTRLPHEFWVNNTGNIIIAIAFHLLIASVFFIRFIFLFFKSSRSLWLSQAFWLLGIISIYSYTVATSGAFFSDRDPSHFCMDCMYTETFRFASDSFVIIVLSYFELSILKQIIFWIISIVSALRK